MSTQSNFSTNTANLIAGSIFRDAKRDFSSDDLYTWSGKMCICGEVIDLHPEVEGYEKYTTQFTTYLTNDLEWLYEFKTDIHRTDYHNDPLYLNNYVFKLKSDNDCLYMLETTYVPHEWFYGKWHRVINSVSTRFTKISLNEIDKLQLYLSSGKDVCYNSNDLNDNYCEAVKNDYADRWDENGEYGFDMNILNTIPSNRCLFNTRCYLYKNHATLN